MSETDIRNLSVEELKEQILELTIKIGNFEQAKKDYAKKFERTTAKQSG
jgi:hypothetical protein